MLTRRALQRTVFSGLMAGWLLGCTGPARRPPGMPPSPESITMSEPGGDAYEPHLAALERQLEQSWGWRSDKDDQVHFPLPDWENWRRIRLRLVEHLTSFKYGDDKHLLSAAFVVELPAGTEVSSAACMEHFEAKALVKARAYNVSYTSPVEHVRRWKRRPLIIHATDGELSFLFSRYEFSAAWAAYPAYENGCLVYGVVVQWEGQPDLARQVRDRWVAEGFTGIRTLTKTLPFRH